MSSGMSGIDKTTKQVFVAYPYTLYDKKAYRQAYRRAGDEYGVDFFFADERITNMHILQKIQRQILIADFSIFDISGWNPNVALELGIAYASEGTSWYICYNPSKNAHQDVPSDLRGIDRIQYSDLRELERKLVVLLNQRYPGQRPEPLSEHELQMRNRVPAVLRDAGAGMSTREVADTLKITQNMALVLLEALLADGEIQSVGATKGRKYLLND